jgi:hypothetical protein
MEEKKPSFEQNPGVSFPSVGRESKSGGPKTILIAGILILVAVLGFVVYKSATKSQESATPSPFDNTITPSEETSTVSTPSPAATPKASDKKNVSISILNGTGISGEAAYLQTQLEALGYSDIKAGNASSQDATTTTVVFSKDLASDIVSEITQKLNSIYQKVTTSTSSSATTDVVITTGLRKGATAKPSATPTGTPKATTTPTASPTATPST